MSDLSLPDGFEWIARTSDAVRFKHVASGKVGGLSDCEIAVNGSNITQEQLDWMCARKIYEAALDAEWSSMGRDQGRFDEWRKVPKNVGMAVALMMLKDRA